MTAHDSRPTVGHSDPADETVRNEHDRKPEGAQPHHSGSPIPEDLGELHDTQSDLMLEGDAYGAYGIDSEPESASSGSPGSTPAGEAPGHVTNEDPSGDGPAGVVQPDDRILELVCERLSDDHLVDISDVSVEVSNGCVALKGTIPDQRMSAMIEDLVGKCPDVKAVTNLLQAP